MREDIAGPQGASSRPMWETLERMVREKAQEFIQQIMEVVRSPAPATIVPKPPMHYYSSWTSQWGPSLMWLDGRSGC